MATINVKAVVGRFSSSFTARRKTIDSCLAALKRYFTDIKPKTTKGGVETSCAEITNFLPGMLTEFETLQRKHAELKEECDNAMFYKHEDQAAGGSRTSLSHYLNFISQHIEHHVRLYKNQSVVRAYESALKRKDAIIQAINAAITMNKEFEKTIKTFLHSARFAELTTAPHSLVAIGPSEVRGTKQQKRDFFRAIDPELIDELRRERHLDKTFIERANGANGSEHSANGEQTEDDDVLAPRKDEPAEHEADDELVLDADEEEEEEEDEDDEDEDDDEDDEDKDDENGERSAAESGDDDGAASSEVHLSENEAVLQEVAANADVRAGRTFRKRKYNIIDLDTYGELVAATNAVIEDAQNHQAPAAELAATVRAEQNGIKKKKKKKKQQLNGNDEADGSAMSEEDSDPEITKMLARKKAEAAAKQSKSIVPKGK